MLKEMPASKAYRLLESGPVVMVATQAKDGRLNLMTMGFHMMMQHEPALVGVVIGPWDHSYEALSETGECVLAIPTVDLAEIVVDIGHCSGADVDKFEKFGLTAVSAGEVQAPLVKDCIARGNRGTNLASSIPALNISICPTRTCVLQPPVGSNVGPGESMSLQKCLQIVR